MLYDEATIRVILPPRTRSNITCHRNLFDPCATRLRIYARLVDNTVEVLIDGILPLATLIPPNKPEAELILSHKQKVLISSPADLVSAPRGLLTFGSKMVSSRTDTQLTYNDDGGPRAAGDKSCDPGIQVRISRREYEYAPSRA